MHTACVDLSDCVFVCVYKYVFLDLDPASIHKHTQKRTQSFYAYTYMYIFIYFLQNRDVLNRDSQFMYMYSVWAA